MTFSESIADAKRAAEASKQDPAMHSLALAVMELARGMEEAVKEIKGELDRVKALLRSR